MNNLFGTDGIRNTVGSFPLTADGLPKLGQAIGTWLKRKYIHTPKLLIAYDSRSSSSFLKHSLSSGILRYPIKIFDGGVLPTPAVFQLVQKQQLFDCGIIITASHNGYLDNGIKIVTRTTGRILPRDEREISDILSNRDFNPVNYKLVGTSTTFNDGKEKYKAYLKNYFESNFLKGISIALDCANGATSNIAPEIFRDFGANVFTTKNLPNGKNINFGCGSNYPESIKSFVKSKNADIGFAFDGDGDRLTIATKSGEIKDGDDLLHLLMEHEAIKKETAIVGTVMSNTGLTEELKSRNIELMAAQVGEKSVMTKLIYEGLLLGGEPSGHVIMRDYLSCSDAIFVALRIMEVIKNNENWNLKTFKKYPQLLKNIPVRIKQNLKQEPFRSLIEKYKSKVSPGRILVRHSGTENILRVLIESENNNSKIADNFITEFREAEKGLKGGTFYGKKIIRQKTV
jgi:phosphoglucosamine mutase